MKQKILCGISLVCLVGLYIVMNCIETNTIPLISGFALMLMGIAGMWVSLYFAGMLIFKPEKKVKK